MEPSTPTTAEKFRSTAALLMIVEGDVDAVGVLKW